MLPFGSTTLNAGKFLGAVTAAYAKIGPLGVGRPDFADWRLFYNGPWFDGCQPPKAGASRWRFPVFEGVIC